jgi:multiple sugar transport system ATP-binding protein
LASVTIDRLSKSYGGSRQPAVRDVSLTIQDGEFMVLLGPSGCGKSSVLRMIAGLEPITAGSVSIDGRTVNDIPAKARDIAMVFQSYALYPPMPVHENRAFGLRRRGSKRDDIDRQVRRAAERLGLSDFLGRRPSALSGGQRQRVALGRAIVRDPKVLLLDEPLSNLDAALRMTTRNEIIKQQAELGTTTIYVTHDQIEAMTMGHRICIMNKGQVVQVGRPMEVYRAPADTFVAQFLGSPPMNLMTVGIEPGGGRPRVVDAALQFDLGGASSDLAAVVARGQVILGFRPEDIYEAADAQAAAPMLPLNVRVAAIEHLGAETLALLVLVSSSQEITARFGRGCTLRPNDVTTVALDLGAVHLFDPLSTKAISGATAATRM